MLSTHLNKKSVAHMIDVSQKKSSLRQAKAQSTIFLEKKIIKLIKKNPQTKKGHLFSVCILAGIMAAKKTSEMIPLCHPLPLEKIQIEYEILDDKIIFFAEVKTHWITGVEMEALTAASTAALTCYDMLKSHSKAMVIGEIKLIFKKGGKSGDYYA